MTTTRNNASAENLVDVVFTKIKEKFFDILTSGNHKTAEMIQNYRTVDALYLMVTPN